MKNIVKPLLFLLATSIIFSGCKPYQKVACSGPLPASAHWNSSNTMKKSLDPAIPNTDSSISHHGSIGSCSFNCDAGSFFDAASNSCLPDVITFSPVYSAMSACTAVNACDGVGSQSRVIDSCQKLLNGASVAGGTLADCASFAIPTNLTASCNSPAGNIAGIAIPGGTKTVSCLSGSNVQTFVSVTCDIGFHANGQNCDIDVLANDPFTKMLLHFDNSLADSSINTYSIDPGYTPVYSTGKFGQGVSSFSGTNKLKISTPAILDFSGTGGDFTIELFAKFVSNGQSQFIFDRGNSSTHYGLAIAPGGTFTIFFQSGSLGTATPKSNPYDGNFHHIAFTYRSNGGFRAYMDGVSMYIAVQEILIPHVDDSLVLGQSVKWQGVWPFVGVIDDFRLSSQARDSIVGGVGTIAVPTAPMN